MTESSQPPTAAPASTDAGATPPTPFHDLDAYLRLPRASGLALSPDGTRLVTTVATLSSDQTRYGTALWEVDPGGTREPRRITRSAKGESAATFLPDGSLLFTSARPDPEPPEGTDADDAAVLWLLPAGGGEARVVGRRGAGVGGVRVARSGSRAVLASSSFLHSDDDAADDHVRAERKKKKVSAVLHERYPVRHWDHDLGASRPRLYVTELGDLGPGTAGQVEPVLSLRDLTPRAAGHLDEASYDISPDGGTVVTTWEIDEVGGSRSGLAVLDADTGERRMLIEDPALEAGDPRFSPDGRRLLVVLGTRSTATEPGDRFLALVDVATGQWTRLVAAWDRWPSDVEWSADSRAVFVAADEDGRSPVFRIEVDGGTVTRLTADAAAYTSLVASRDGAHLYAMRSSYLAPAHPVRLDPGSRDQRPPALPAPAPSPELPGRLTEVETTAADGTRVRSWLALPHTAGPEDPAPLLLWIHGGPLGSWNAWSWRWNPWLMVAQGYAVLLPDPALSTGYGLDFVRRGWGRWGDAPFTDLMAATTEAEAHPDVDATRTAALGGSFGGYMANWVATHTDRFDAIVTHASLWALDQFARTTDHAGYWLREMTPEMAAEYSPHHYVADIVTPMLVIHGDKDYRVPIGEGLRLWYDLASHASADDGEMPHKFLYFPDENHWILAPQHAKVWYQTVLAFLATHVRGEAWEAPHLLG